MLKLSHQHWFFLGSIGLLLCGITFFSGLLAPLFLGLGMAYILRPMQARLVHHKIPPTIAAGLLVLTTIASVIILGMMVVEVILHSVPLIKAQLPSLLNKLTSLLKEFSERTGINPQIDPEQLRGIIATKLSGEFDSIASGVIDTIRFSSGAILQTLAISVLFPLSLFYLLLSWSEIIDYVQSIIPPEWRSPILHFIQETDDTLSGFLRGQFLVMLILMIYYTLALWLVGLKLYMPLGIFSGAAYVIPYIGFGLSMILASLEALLQLQTWVGIAMVIAIYGFGQFIESFWLTPKLIGSRIGLSPLIVIFSLLVFGQLLGFWGVLLALPLSAIIAVLIRQLYQYVYVRNNEQNQTSTDQRITVVSLSTTPSKKLPKPLASHPSIGRKRTWPTKHR